MSVQVRRRREAASFLASFVGAQGELIVDTTNNRVQVHDGATPGGFPAAKLADVVGRTALGDAAYAAQAGDRTIAFPSLTAARTVTLPAASAFPTGTQLLVLDESGACSATRTITLSRAGADTINGSASAAIALPYGFLALTSDGASRWTIVDQSTAGMAQQAATAVAITGGTIDGTAIGTTTPAAGAFTSLSASGTASLYALTVTNGFVQMSSTGGSASVFRFYSAGAAADQKYSDFFYNPGSGNFSWRLLSDTLATANSVMTYGRSGATVGAVNWYGSSFAVNTTLAVTGAATLTGAVTLGNTLGLKTYTVATLPAAGTPGRSVYCSNARVFNGAGTQEASGSGSGGLVTDSGSAWRIAGTNITAQA